MATVGNANVDITADSSQARQEVTGFTGFLQKTGSIAAGVMGGFAVFETVKSTFAGLYDATIGMNASMEQYQNTLTTVTGSSKKAADLMSWVKDFAASTPFEIPGLVEAATKLEAYGLSATEWLPSIGDMAAVMGKDVNQATEAIADAMTGEMERLKEFGITKDMVIQQGKEMRMAAFVNSQGQITDQQAFNKALMALMKERFEGGMELQSQSFKGLISNARDSMGQLMTTMSEPIFDGLKEQLKTVVPVMGAFTAYVQGDMDKAMEGLQANFGQDKAQEIMNFFEGIRDGVMQARDWFLQFQPTVENIIRIVKGMGPVFQEVGGLIAVAWGAVAQVLPPIVNMITDIAAAVVEWKGFAPIVATLAAAFGTAYAAIKIYNTVLLLSNTYTKIATTLMYAHRAAQLAFVIAGGGVRGAIAAITMSFRALNLTMLANPFVWIPALIVAVGVALYELYKHSETFRNVVNKLGAAIRDGFVTALNWAKENLGFVVDYFKTSFENLKTIVMGALDVIVGLFTGDFGRMKSGVLQIIGGFKDQFLNYLNLLKNGALLIPEDIRAGFMEKFGGLITALTPIFETYVGYIKNTFENMKNIVLGIVDVLAGLLTGDMDTLTSGLLQIWTGFKDQFINNFTTWKDLLAQIGQAMLTGITETIPPGLRQAWSDIQTDWAAMQTFFTVTMPEAWRIMVGLFDTDTSDWKTIWATLIEQLKTDGENLRLFFTEDIPSWWTTLSQKLAETTAPFAQKLDEWNQTGQTKLEEWKTNFLTWFDNLKTNIPIKLEEWKTSFITWFDEMKATLPVKFAEWVTSIKTWMEEQNQLNKEFYWGKIGQPILDFFTELPGRVREKLETWKTDITTWFTEKTESWGTDLEQWGTRILTWFTELPGRVRTKLEEWKTNITSWFTEKVESWGSDLEQWGTKILTWFTELPGRVRTKLEEWKTNITSWFTEKIEGIKSDLEQWGTTILTWFTNLPTRVREKLETWKSNITSWFTEKVESVKQDLEKWGTTILNWFTELPGRVRVKLDEWKNNIVSWATKTKEDWTRSLEGWWQTIKTWFNGLKDKPEVKNSGKDLVKKVTDGTEEQKKTLFDKLGKIIVDALTFMLAFAAIALLAAGREVIKRIISGISDANASLNKKMTDITNGIVKKVKGVSLRQVGKDMIQGLINGMGAMGSALWNAASKLAGKAIDAIKSKLGIKSPSRVMIEVGTFTGKGFEIGLDDMIANAVKKARELGTRVVEAVRQTGQFGQELFKLPKDNPVKKYFDGIKNGNFVESIRSRLPDAHAILRTNLDPSHFEGIPVTVGNALKESIKDAVPKQEQHIHNWNVQAEEINDVTKLIDVVNGIVQTVRSR